MKIKIENFRVINKPDLPRLKAVTDIVLDEIIMIKDIKLIENNNEQFIAMPCRKGTTGEFRDICHPTDINLRRDIERAIKEHFKYGMYTDGFKEDIKITEVKVKKIDLNSPLKVVASVLFNNKFVVHDIKLVERAAIDSTQTRFELYMPTKKVDENFVKVVDLLNENLCKEILEKIVKQYKGM